MSDCNNYKWAAVRFYNNQSKVNKESIVEISKIIKFNPDKLHEDYIVLQKASDGTEYEAAAQLLRLGERREDIENKKDADETGTRTRYNNKRESTAFQEIRARNKVDDPKVVETDEEEEDEDDEWVSKNKENQSNNTKKRTRPNKKGFATFYDPQQVEIIDEKIKSLSEVKVSFEPPSKKSSSSEVELGQELQPLEKNDDDLNEYDLELQRKILEKKLELIELDLKAKRRHDKIQFADPSNSSSKLEMNHELLKQNLSGSKNVQPIKQDSKADEFDDDFASLESFQHTNNKSNSPSTSSGEINESEQGTSQVKLTNKRSISPSPPPSKKKKCSERINSEDTAEEISVKWPKKVGRNVDKIKLAEDLIAKEKAIFSHHFVLDNKGKKVDDNSEYTNADNQRMYHACYGVTFPYAGYKQSKSSRTMSLYTANSARSIWTPEILAKRALEMQKVNANRVSGRKECSPRKLACLHRLYHDRVLKKIVGKSEQAKEILKCNTYLSSCINNTIQSESKRNDDLFKQKEVPDAVDMSE